MTFKNIGQHYLYVAVSGPCATGFTNVSILSLPAGQSKIVPADGPLCFGYSAYPLPLDALWGGGEVKPGETLEIPTSSELLRINNPDQRTASAQPDSAVLVGASALDHAKNMKSSIAGLASLQAATADGPARIERSLVSWLDHTSRQSATDCVQEAVIDIPFDGQIRTCTGWRTRWRCPRNEAVLVVHTLDPNRATEAISSCLTTAAVVGALAGISTGGSAAVPAAKAAFVVCLGDAAIDADIEIRGGWTDWGGC